MIQSQSIFDQEAFPKIVDKSTETISISSENIIQKGELFLVKQKSQDNPKKCNFMLTKDFLYYVSKVKETEGCLKINTKAKIHLNWLRTSFYSKSDIDKSKKTYFIEIKKNNKSVIFECRNIDEYEMWVINLSKLTIQVNFHKKYTVEKLLGQGGSAKVYEIVNNFNSKRFACKKFYKKN